MLDWRVLDTVQRRQRPGLTRGDIWVLALAAHQAQVERVGAVLQHFDDDGVSATAGGPGGDDVSLCHGVQMRANCGLRSRQP